MKSLAEMKDLSPVVSHLKDIANHALTQTNLRCAINASPNAMTTIATETEKFLSQLRLPSNETAMETYTHVCTVCSLWLSSGT